MADRSPGVYMRELDLSDYIQAVSGTIFAVLGGATKGAVNDPVEVFSEEDMIQKFGTPQLGDYGYGLHAMKEFLAEGRRGVYIRVSDGTDVEADVDVCDDSAAPAYGAPLGEFKAISPGTWGNYVKVVISDVVEYPALSSNYVFNLEIQVPADNQMPPQTYATVESWNYLQDELKLSTDPTSDRWYEDVINRGLDGEIAASRYIEVTAIANLKPIEGTFTLGTASFVETAGGTTQTIPGINYTAGADGVSGLTDADYIGAYVGQTQTGLKIIANAEKTDVNMVAIPGVFSGPVVNEMLAVCEARADCFAIPDPPFGLDDAGVIDYHNGVGYGHAAFNTSYGALYWSWVKAYDQYSKKELWLPPSGFIAARYAYTDRVRGSHWAPAGLQRGRLNRALDLEMSPSPEQRDALYTGGNCVNPLVDFVGQGIHVWGQKTLQRRATALQSVNVRRMVLLAKKVVGRSVRYLNFEQNDESLWRQFTGLLTPYFQRLKQERGLYDFRIIADSSTTTSEKINQGIMNGRILLQPTRAAEVIEVDFVILAAGASFSEAA